MGEPKVTPAIILEKAIEILDPATGSKEVMGSLSLVFDTEAEDLVVLPVVPNLAGPILGFLVKRSICPPCSQWHEVIFHASLYFLHRLNFIL